MDNTREKLMRIVCDGLEDGCAGHCNYPHCYRVNNVADHLIANGVTVQKWIPVTERLPEMLGKYLVTGRSFRDRISQIWICECISIGHVKGWSNHALNPIVEAWMPLPEPPKED